MALDFVGSASFGLLIAFASYSFHSFYFFQHSDIFHIEINDCWIVITVLLSAFALKSTLSYGNVAIPSFFYLFLFIRKIFFSYVISAPSLGLDMTLRPRVAFSADCLFFDVFDSLESNLLHFHPSLLLVGI